MKKKRKVLSAIMAFVVACSFLPVETNAAEPGANQEENGSLTPSDLHFRKFYTGRNLFDSEIPILDMNLEEAAGQGKLSTYGDGKLKFAGAENETVQNQLELGAMTPYSVYDLNVSGQKAGDGAAMAEIRWEKDENNFVALKKASVSESGEEPSEPEEVLYSLDMTDPDLLESLNIYADMYAQHRVEMTDGGIRLTSGANRGETYISAGTLMQDTVLEAEISEQVKQGYTASAILKFRDKTADNSKTNGIYLTQRSGGSFGLEVFKNGSAVYSNGSIAGSVSSYPYKLRMALHGNTVTVSRVVDGKESSVTAVDVGQWFDLEDESVLANFEASFGGKLGDNESVTYSSVQIKKYTAESDVISSIDMDDPDLLDKLNIYADMSARHTVEQTEGGIRLTSGANKGETYISAGSLQQDTVIEAEISEQVKKGYTASAILKFRDKTADNSRTNGVYLTQRAGGNYGLEIFKNGTAVYSDGSIAGSVSSYPYRLRMALHGSTVTVSRVVDGKEEALVSVDAGQWFDFEDENVLKNFEATFGGKLGDGESVTYSSVQIRKYEPPSETGLPESDDGFILQVRKDGADRVNKPISYPENISLSRPYTMRAHWAGQYLSIWFVQDGRPTLMTTEDLNSSFDMRDSKVYSEFSAYLKTTVVNNGELEISGFRNYYTGGDGQADPKPLHYEDGTVIVEDGKMWISMTLRGYQPLPASCQGIYSFDLDTYELQLVNITTFRKPGETREWGYHASDFCFDRNSGKWIVVTSSHGDDKKLRIGELSADPRTQTYLTAEVEPMEYNGNRSNYEDPSIIYDKDAGKWRIASCFSGNGGFNVALLESDSFNGTYTEIAAYESGSCTGILMQKVGGEYYVFTGRSVSERQMNLEALNYPEMTKNTSLSIDGETESYNPWPMLFPLENEEGETVYRLLSFDRDSIMANDGSMVGGQYSYGRIYLYEALEKDNSKDTAMDVPEVTAENTEIITNADQLWAVSGNMAGNYKLGADIDLSGRQWYPLGTADNPFTGSFDGAGYRITGLTAAETSDMTGVGLFGYTAESAEITNVTLEDVNVSGRIYTGGLAGYNKGTISRCTVTGTVTGESETGLLAGRNSGTITGCSVKGTVTGTGNDSTGGIAGANSQGKISQCRADVEAAGTINVGGLTGYNDRGNIDNSYARGTVRGSNYVGGLAGASSASGLDKNCSIDKCYADCEVEGMTAGGLAGFNDKNVTDSFSVGTVTGEKVTGGLIGRNNQYGNVNNCYSGTRVSGNEYAGQLFGKNTGSFRNTACLTGAGHIGNSPDSIVSEEVPDFTSSDTFSAGALSGWDESIWTTGEGLPKLINIPEITEYVTITYEAREGGRIEGETVQKVAKGGQTSRVEAIAEEGYEFAGWSDGLKETARTDTAEKDMTVTAQFEKIPSPAEPELEKITVTPPDKTEYLKGEELDITGMKVMAVYDDGTKTEITEGYEITGYNPDQIGEQTITVSYQNLNAQFRVTVKEEPGTDPEEPGTDPEEPGTAQKETVDSENQVAVQTGDDSRPFVWMTFMLTGAGGAVIVYSWKRRNGKV